MSNRPNISPSGWLSNLGKQPRQQKSLANRQQEWLQNHWWLLQSHYALKITKQQLAEAIELQVVDHLAPSNRTAE
jgi:hypothetical protein